MYLYVVSGRTNKNSRTHFIRVLSYIFIRFCNMHKTKESKSLAHKHAHMQRGFFTCTLQSIAMTGMVVMAVTPFHTSPGFLENIRRFKPLLR